jgi:polysaccharide biosynthesis PFTS motif protein
MFRGYHLLKKTDNLDLLPKINEALTERKLKLRKGFFPYFIMGQAESYTEIALRQYLLVRIGGMKLNKIILFSMGKARKTIIHPLPKEWRVVLSEYGFDVAHRRSSFLWQIYIFLALFYGVFQIFNEIVLLCKSLPANKIKYNYAYFVNLNSTNIPKSNKANKSYNIISWYLQWYDRSKDIKAIHHSVANIALKSVKNIPLIYQSKIHPPITGFLPFIKFMIWCLGAFFITFINLLFGRWWYAFLFNQMVLSAKVRFIPKKFLAKEYYFHQSSWIYRPLWTYDAEKSGSEIILYFYSTNIQRFKFKKSNPSIVYGYKAMSWESYLVWDKFQANYIKKCVGLKPIIKIVGPIWFQDESFIIPKYRSRGIAVFDVAPHRISSHITLGSLCEYYNATVVNTFLKQVSDALLEKNFIMYWKRKRDLSKLIEHPRYRKMSEHLKKCKHVRVVNSMTNVKHIIDSSIAVITMPYSSTALIAKECGKPTIFFDPTGTIDKKDESRHGIPLLSNIDELKDWISKF